jgi:hypothetical protein
MNGISKKMKPPHINNEIAGGNETIESVVADEYVSGTADQLGTNIATHIRHLASAPP